jgi:anti-sigma-K factor RskA
MTSRTPVLNEKDNITAAEYALGVLQGDARVNFARRIESEPTLAATVRGWDEHFANFAEDIAPVQPPAHIEKALEKRLFADASSRSKPSFWNSLALWRGLAIASLAGVLALGVWTLKPAPANHALVAQVAAQQGNFKLVALYDNATGELRLNRVEGTAASGRSHEVWLIAGTDAPVSLGILADAATTRVTVPTALRAKFASGILAVSDEPKGGSPTGAPTGAVLATGALTEV